MSKKPLDWDALFTDFYQGKPAPMTISLEEHVARLVKALEPFAGLAQGIPDAAHDAAPACRIGQDAKFPGTFTTITNGAFRNARAAIADVREREGAASPACPVDVCPYEGPCDQAVATGHCPYRDGEPAPSPAEAMRAECEKIARQEEVRNPSNNGTQSARRIKRAIAALKGNGEGR